MRGFLAFVLVLILGSWVRYSFGDFQAVVGRSLAEQFVIGFILMSALLVYFARVADQVKENEEDTAATTKLLHERISRVSNRVAELETRQSS